MLGLEIRDKVTNYVGEKINSVRINTDYEEYNNIAVVRTNVMKGILNYFQKGQLSKLFFCFADPHFKRDNFRRRIINQSLLTEYAYLMEEGGKIYTVTDVKDLYDWNVEFLGKHPLFEEITGEEKENDPCMKIMSEKTNEAGIVLKRGDPVWAAVFRKKVMPIEEEMLNYYFN